MLNLLRSLIPNDYARALVLKGLRWAGAAAAGALVPILIAHGVSQADAATIGGAIAALILGGGSAIFSVVDANKVDAQVKDTQAATAATVASAIQSGATTPATITNAVHAGPTALAKTIAALRAGAA